MSTFIFLAGIMVFLFLINAFLLQLWARVWKAPPLGFGRTLLILIVLYPLNGFLSLIIWWLEQADLPWPALALTLFLLFLLWFLLVWGLQTGRGRALLVGLSWVLSSLLVVGGFALFLVPLVVPFYVVPTNSMAPTLVGPHKAGECPRCGQKLVVSYNPMFPEVFERQGILGICQSFHIAKVNKWHPKTLVPDRFACNRWLSLRRWDLVVFRLPPDPSRKYVQRLIGLPGEEVVIKDKGIWINGTKLQVPEELAGLEYASTDDRDDLDMWEGNCWGSPSNPAKLGEKEYFVLGDFTRASNDSRFWKAVPEANFEGVASLIYWPPNRWRILR